MRCRIACALLLASGTAQAAKHRRFEPTDLDLEHGGVLALDLQFGVIRGPDATRIVVPDFEVDLGILSFLELDVDGAFALEARSGGPAVFDPLWVSAKIGVADWREGDRAWAIGMQLGPKLPALSGTSGVGVEGLVLVGRTDGLVHVALEAGGLIDPRATKLEPRPVGLEAGLDVELELVRDRWSALGELGGVYYTSPDPDQLGVAVGLQYSPLTRLDVSLVALAGVGPGSDRYGLLLGVSPKLTIW